MNVDEKIDFTRSWHLPKTGIFEFDFMDTSAHCQMLQTHLSTSDGDDIEKLSGRIKNIYRLLKEQCHLQSITNEDRDNFFNTRVLSILRAYDKTLTCLQMNKILHYIVHGEHHHELHPSYSASHEVIHEDALRHQDESTISRDHHIIDAIIAMFPKIIDTANIHILLLIPNKLEH